jgi:O-Antigen ligase
MQILVFVALALSIYQIKRYSIADAAINVFLSIFLLVPDFYSFNIPHLPPLTFATAALLPIVVALIATHGNEWKFQRADLWLALFFLGAFYSELSHTTLSNAGLLLIGGIFTGVMPYILGKMLLERDGVRERFVRRLVLLFFIISILSLWEFRMGTNIFTIPGRYLFPSQQPLPSQVRNGFVRIAGPFAGAELGGMLFGPAFLLSVWLGFLDKTRGDERKFMGIRRSTLRSAAIALGLYMTLSRGPWLGAILGYLITRIGIAKNMRRATILTMLLLVAGGAYGYIKAKEYTSGDIFAAKNQEQENAIYRRQLLDNYKPIVERGGIFGYGVVSFPKAQGQSSIDNAYLFFQVTQGKLGLWTFLLLSAECFLCVTQAIRRSTQRTDACFALCIGGGIACILFTITTVYLGGPSYPMLFLLFGWSQSLRQTQSTSAAVPVASSSRYAFRRVIA